MIKICIWSSSIGEGHNDLANGGWVSYLQKDFFNQNKNIIIYNLSISGDSSKELLKRFEVEAKARNPHIIIFSIGLNDSYYFNKTGKYYVSLIDFEKNLNILYDQAKNITNNIIFLGLTNIEDSKLMPVPWEKEISYDAKSVIKYDKMIESFCKKNSILFLDMFDLLNFQDLDDGLHPNSQGHNKMFHRIKNFILEKKLI